MGEALWMSRKERDRLVELQLVASQKQTLKTAAGRLRLSYRQAKRVWRRYQHDGAAGLVHRSRAVGQRRGQEFRRDDRLSGLFGFGRRGPAYPA